MADYIRRDIVLEIINTVNDTGGFAGYADYCVLFDEIDTMPAADAQPLSVVAEHIKKRLYETAFNTNEAEARNAIAAMAERIDFWIDELKEGDAK